MKISKLLAKFNAAIHKYKLYKSIFTSEMR